jgi:hypothetical protein
MPTLHLILFKLPVFSRDTAHWALFLPNKDGEPPGILFHITKESCVSWKTEYRQKDFLPRPSPELESILAISEINISKVALDAACQRVTHSRDFNIVNKNCRHWVSEVVDDLVRTYQLGEVDILGKVKTLGCKVKLEKCKKANVIDLGSK